MSKEIQATYELVGAGLSTLPAEAIAEARADFSGFLKNLGIEGDLTGAVAENSASEIHLCLPYYSYVDAAATAARSAVADSELHVSGGLHYDGLYRLPATDDVGEMNARNAHQVAHNIRMAFTNQHHRMDGTFDGDFDVDGNPTHPDK